MYTKMNICIYVFNLGQNKFRPKCHSAKNEKTILAKRNRFEFYFHHQL